MSASDHVQPGSPSEDDVLAGEYVLGVLDGARRAAVARRIADDPAFAARVDDWRAHLSPLDNAYEEVTPPHGVWLGIEGSLFERRTQPAGFWHSLAFWRTCAVAASLLLVVVAGLWTSGVMLDGRGAQPVQLAAVLQADGSDVRMLALYDPVSQTLRLNTLAGEPGAERDFELWLIEADQPPVSMGVVPKTARATLAVAPALRGKLASGVTLAISLEPAGGSPTGSATGPVVAAGSVGAI